jgi:hypothetical protein
VTAADRPGVVTRSGFSFPISVIRRPRSGGSVEFPWEVREAVWLGMAKPERQPAAEAHVASLEFQL